MDPRIKQPRTHDTDKNNKRIQSRNTRVLKKNVDKHNTTRRQTQQAKHETSTCLHLPEMQRMVRYHRQSQTMPSNKTNNLLSMS